MKFKYIMLLLSAVFVLGACDEDIDISLIEDDTEVVNSNVSEDVVESEVSFEEQAMEFAKIVEDFYVDTKQLSLIVHPPKDDEMKQYKNVINNSIIRLMEIELNPKTKEDQIVYNQILSVKIQLELLQDAGLNKLNTWNGTNAKLFTSYKESTGLEFDKLKMLIANYYE